MLTCYLKGKRATRLTNGKLVERLHLLLIIEHSTIDDALMRSRILLEIAVVRRDDAPRPLLIKECQKPLRYGSTQLRLRASSKLINQEQTIRSASGRHSSHVLQVRGVSTQIVLHRLIVAYLYR